MKFKIKHKTEGWTGTLEIEDVFNICNWSSSHRCGGKLPFTIDQDDHKPDGSYVEDPWVNSLDELELVELVSRKE